MSTQEFTGAVGQVVQAETVTQNVTKVMNDGGRALTRQERIALNNKVKQLAGEFGESGRDVWIRMHTAIGIQNIDDMQLGHRDVAHTILDLMLECAELKQQLSGPCRQSEADASYQATLVLKNSDLESKLNETLKLRKRLEERIVDLEQNCRRLSSRAAESEEMAIKTEVLLNDRTKKYQRLRQSEQQERRRGNRMALAAAVSFVIMVGAVAVMFYYARWAEAFLSQCELNGKPYAIGTVIQGRPDQLCTRSNDGWAVWQPKPRDNKR